MAIIRGGGGLSRIQKGDEEERKKKLKIAQQRQVAPPRKPKPPVSIPEQPWGVKLPQLGSEDLEQDPLPANIENLALAAQGNDIHLDASQAHSLLATATSIYSPDEWAHFLMPHIMGKFPYSGAFHNKLMKVIENYMDSSGRLPDAKMAHLLMTTDFVEQGGGLVKPRKYIDPAARAMDVLDDKTLLVKPADLDLFSVLTDGAGTGNRPPDPLVPSRPDPTKGPEAPAEVKENEKRKREKRWSLRDLEKWGDIDTADYMRQLANRPQYTLGKTWKPGQGRETITDRDRQLIDEARAWYMGTDLKAAILENQRKRGHTPGTGKARGATTDVVRPDGTIDPYAVQLIKSLTKDRGPGSQVRDDFITLQKKAYGKNKLSIYNQKLVDMLGERLTNVFGDVKPLDNGHYKWDDTFDLGARRFLMMASLNAAVAVNPHDQRDNPHEYAAVENDRRIAMANISIATGGQIQTSDNIREWLTNAKLLPKDTDKYHLFSEKFSDFLFYHCFLKTEVSSHTPLPIAMSKFVEKYAGGDMRALPADVRDQYIEGLKYVSALEGQWDVKRSNATYAANPLLIVFEDAFLGKQKEDVQRVMSKKPGAPGTDEEWLAAQTGWVKHVRTSSWADYYFFSDPSGVEKDKTGVHRKQGPDFEYYVGITSDGKVVTSKSLPDKTPDDFWWTRKVDPDNSFRMWLHTAVVPAVYGTLGPVLDNLQTNMSKIWTPIERKKAEAMHTTALVGDIEGSGSSWHNLFSILFPGPTALTVEKIAKAAGAPDMADALVDIKEGGGKMGTAAKVVLPSVIHQRIALPDAPWRIRRDHIVQAYADARRESEDPGSWAKYQLRSLGLDPDSEAYLTFTTDLMWSIGLDMLMDFGITSIAKAGLKSVAKIVSKMSSKKILAKVAAAKEVIDAAKPAGTIPETLGGIQWGPVKATMKGGAKKPRTPYILTPEDAGEIGGKVNKAYQELAELGADELAGLTGKKAYEKTAAKYAGITPEQMLTKRADIIADLQLLNRPMWYDTMAMALAGGKQRPTILMELFGFRMSMVPEGYRNSAMVLLRGIGEATDPDDIVILTNRLAHRTGLKLDPGRLMWGKMKAHRDLLSGKLGFDAWVKQLPSGRRLRGELVDAEHFVLTTSRATRMGLPRGQDKKALDLAMRYVKMLEDISVNPKLSPLGRDRARKAVVDEVKALIEQNMKRTRPDVKLYKKIIKYAKRNGLNVDAFESAFFKSQKSGFRGKKAMSQWDLFNAYLQVKQGRVRKTKLGKGLEEGTEAFYHEVQKTDPWHLRHKGALGDTAQDIVLDWSLHDLGVFQNGRTTWQMFTHSDMFVPGTTLSIPYLSPARVAAKGRTVATASVSFVFSALFIDEIHRFVPLLLRREIKFGSVKAAREANKEFMRHVAPDATESLLQQTKEFIPIHGEVHPRAYAAHFSRKAHKMRKDFFYLEFREWLTEIEKELSLHGHSLDDIPIEGQKAMFLDHIETKLASDAAAEIREGMMATGRPYKKDFIRPEEIEARNAERISKIESLELKYKEEIEQLEKARKELADVLTERFSVHEEVGAFVEQPLSKRSISTVRKRLEGYSEYAPSEWKAFTDDPSMETYFKFREALSESLKKSEEVALRRVERDTAILQDATSPVRLMQFKREAMREKLGGKPLTSRNVQEFLDTPHDPALPTDAAIELLYQSDDALRASVDKLVAKRVDDLASGARRAAVNKSSVDVLGDVKWRKNKAGNNTTTIGDTKYEITPKYSKYELRKTKNGKTTPKEVASIDEAKSAVNALYREKYKKLETQKFSETGYEKFSTGKGKVAEFRKKRLAAAQREHEKVSRFGQEISDTRRYKAGEIAPFRTEHEFLPVSQRETTLRALEGTVMLEDFEELLLFLQSRGYKWIKNEKRVKEFKRGLDNIWAEAPGGRRPALRKWMEDHKIDPDDIDDFVLETRAKKLESLGVNLENDLLNQAIKLREQRDRLRRWATQTNKQLWEIRTTKPLSNQLGAEAKRYLNGWVDDLFGYKSNDVLWDAIVNGRKVRWRDVRRMRKSGQYMPVISGARGRRSTWFRPDGTIGWVPILSRYGELLPYKMLDTFGGWTRKAVFYGRFNIEYNNLIKQGFTHAEALSAAQHRSYQFVEKVMYSAGQSLVEHEMGSVAYFIPAYRQAMIYWGREFMRNPMVYGDIRERFKSEMPNTYLGNFGTYLPLPMFMTDSLGEMGVPGLTAPWLAPLRLLNHFTGWTENVDEKETEKQGRLVTKWVYTGDTKLDFLVDHPLLNPLTGFASKRVSPVSFFDDLVFAFFGEMDWEVEADNTLMVFLATLANSMRKDPLIRRKAVNAVYSYQIANGIKPDIDAVGANLEGTPWGLAIIGKIPHMKHPEVALGLVTKELTPRKIDFSPSDIDLPEGYNVTPEGKPAEGELEPRNFTNFWSAFDVFHDASARTMAEAEYTYLQADGDREKQRKILAHYPKLALKYKILGMDAYEREQFLMKEENRFMIPYIYGKSNYDPDTGLPVTRHEYFLQRTKGAILRKSNREWLNGLNMFFADADWTSARKKLDDQLELDLAACDKNVDKMLKAKYDVTTPYGRNMYDRNMRDYAGYKEKWWGKGADKEVARGTYCPPDWLEVLAMETYGSKYLEHQQEWNPLAARTLHKWRTEETGTAPKTDVEALYELEGEKPQRPAGARPLGLRERFLTRGATTEDGANDLVRISEALEPLLMPDQAGMFDVMEGVNSWAIGEARENYLSRRRSKLRKMIGNDYYTVHSSDDLAEVFPGIYDPHTGLGSPMEMRLWLVAQAEAYEKKSTAYGDKAAPDYYSDDAKRAQAEFNRTMERLMKQPIAKVWKDGPAGQILYSFLVETGEEKKWDKGYAKMVAKAIVGNKKPSNDVLVARFQSSKYERQEEAISANIWASFAIAALACREKIEYERKNNTGKIGSTQRESAIRLNAYAEEWSKHSDMFKEDWISMRGSKFFQALFGKPY